jgi:hypothetical protein
MGWGPDDEESMGRQAMKVSLSASVRQLRCMAYSSGRVSGSDAVASWIFYRHRLSLSFDQMEWIGFVLHLSSKSGRWARDGLRREQGGCWMSKSLC